MKTPIRVHTLTLPMQDGIAAYILSNPQYTLLVQDRQMTKSGDFILHLQYEDHTGGPDIYPQLQQELEEHLQELEQGLLGVYDGEEEYVPTELKDGKQEKYVDCQDDTDAGDGADHPKPKKERKRSSNPSKPKKRGKG